MNMKDVRIDAYVAGSKTYRATHIPTGIVIEGKRDGETRRAVIERLRIEVDAHNEEAVR